MRMSRLVLVPALLAVTACASVPTAPQSMVQSARTYTPTKGKARIYIWRPNSMFGSAIRFTIQVNGQTIGQVTKGTFLMTEVDPGRAAIAVPTNESFEVVHVDVVADQVYFVKVWPRMGALSARAGIERSSDSEGRDAVNSSRMAVGVTAATAN